MEIVDLAIPEVKLLTPRRHGDARGWFSETWSARLMAERGLDLPFVQDNHALSRPAYTLRGLHFQAPPYAQTKLVRVVRGRILDVAVDARRGSPTFGRHVKAELDAATGTQILVPKGFLHGYLTLEPDTEVLYKVDAFYSRAHDGGVSFADPDLAIDWGVPAERILVSEKDAGLPRLAELATPFTYDA
ncbi:MAG: dTDP-4-dehydrorhamnose 3,5-epimerase [Alphaproteobacteria bacterium]|nr:dTDP-4-dehydrorhamnose 3,5-epimerase [Alphaproteobacteria bacterium]